MLLLEYSSTAFFFLSITVINSVESVSIQILALSMKHKHMHSKLCMIRIT